MINNRTSGVLIREGSLGNGEAFLRFVSEIALRLRYANFALRAEELICLVELLMFKYTFSDWNWIISIGHEPDFAKPACEAMFQGYYATQYGGATCSDNLSN